MHHLWVMRWHALKYLPSPLASLHSSSVSDLFPIWERRGKNPCIHWSDIGKVCAAVFLSSSAFRGFNLKIMFLLCLKIAREKIIQHQHILCQCTFSCNFHIHLHMTEVINLLHFDLCSLCLSACLIVCL